MQRWPWISLALIVVFVVSPAGQDLYRQAFFSGEQLARSLGQLLVYVIAAAAAAAVILEWLLRWWWTRRRKARGGA